MSGFHFFNKDQWHRTENDRDEHCTCGVIVAGKVRGRDDDSWEFAPPESRGKCFDPAPAPPLEGERKAGYVDAYVAAGDKALELAAENQQLRAKLDEHELLFASAIYTDDFMRAVLDGIAKQLPEGTPHTVEGIVTAVAEMALRLDCHEDASTPAFDEIAKLCGCPTWEYPGQVVRDVQHVVKERDDLLKRRDELLATIVRLTNELPFPDEVKNWTSQRAAMVAEVGTLKARVAELEREKQGISDTLHGEIIKAAREACEPTSPTNIAYRRVRAAFPDGGEEARAAFWTFLKEEKAKVAPVVQSPPTQCPWVHDDEDPDEGYWHCKHQRGHDSVHEAEGGKGRSGKWRLPNMEVDQLVVRIADLERDCAVIRRAWDHEIEKNNALERDGRKIDRAFIDDLTNIARERQQKLNQLAAELDEANARARVQQGNVEAERSERLRLSAKVTELEANVRFLADEQLRLIKERDELRGQKNAAYAERDKCVVGLAAMAIRLGWKAWLGRHVGDPWDDDWRNIIFINLPFGQVSWHIHDSELPMFDFLDENEERTWDGHTTEQKYERLLALADGAAPYEPAVVATRHESHPDHACDESCKHCPDCGSNLDRHIAQATMELRVETEALRNALQVIAGYVAGEEPVGTDAAVTLANLARLVLGVADGKPGDTKRCKCSDKYRELNPGWHARYCPLVGMPMEAAQ